MELPSLFYLNNLVYRANNPALAQRSQDRNGYIESLGFTLIEVLVALAIFSIIGLLSYRGLDTIIATKSHLDQEARFWRQLGLIFERMEIDLEQVAPRSWQNAEGQWQPSLIGTSAPEGQSCQLDFVRFQGENRVIHITYRLEEGKWTLQIGPRLIGENVKANSASSARAENQTYLLLDTVTRCELQFLDPEKGWQKDWRSGIQKDRPTGIKILLALAGRGSFERIFYLP